MIKRFLALIIISLLLNPAFCQTLWGPTQVGMKPDEIIKTVGGAYSIDNGNHLWGGVTELVRRDSYEIVRRSFTQHFYFKNDNLVQVTMSLNEKINFDSTLLVFDSLVEALRVRYGKEISYSIKPDRLYRTAQATWVHEGTNIGIHVSAVGEHEASLNVNYQTRIAEDAQKL